MRVSLREPALMIINKSELPDGFGIQWSRLEHFQVFNFGSGIISRFEIAAGAFKEAAFLRFRGSNRPPREGPKPKLRAGKRVGLFAT